MTQRNQEKTLLHNLCVKRNIPKPTYDTKREGGEDHCPVFVSTVTLDDGKVYRGPSAPSRKEAEALVSALILEDLDSEKRIPLVLVDKDELFRVADAIPRNRRNCVDLYVFGMVESIEQGPRIFVCEGIKYVTSSLPVETILSAYLGFFLGKALHSRYIVVCKSPAMTKALDTYSAKSSPLHCRLLFHVTEEQNLRDLLDL